MRRQIVGQRVAVAVYPSQGRDRQSAGRAGDRAAGGDIDPDAVLVLHLDLRQRVVAGADREAAARRLARGARVGTRRLAAARRQPRLVHRDIRNRYARNRVRRDVQRYRRGRLVAIAVGDRVGEAVRPFRSRVGRIGDCPVGIDNRDALGRQHRAQRNTRRRVHPVRAARVVRQHSNRDRRIFRNRNQAIIRRARHIVVDVDRQVRGRGLAAVRVLDIEADVEDGVVLVTLRRMDDRRVLGDRIAAGLVVQRHRQDQGRALQNLKHARRAGRIDAEAGWQAGLRRREIEIEIAVAAGPGQRSRRVGRVGIVVGATGIAAGQRIVVKQNHRRRVRARR